MGMYSRDFCWPAARTRGAGGSSRMMKSRITGMAGRSPLREIGVKSFQPKIEVISWFVGR